jgi:hypothetical protein
MTGVQVVELCGLPGAGKSVLARRLVEACAERGVPFGLPCSPVGPTVRADLRLARKAWLASRATLTRPRQVSSVVGAVMRSGQAGPVEVVARTLAVVVADTLVRQGREGRGPVLLDEGPIQARWSVAVRASASGHMPSMPPEDVRPDLVVWLDCPPDLAAARLAVRASRHARVQRLDQVGRLRELRRGRDRLVELAASWARLSGDAALVTLPAGPSGVPAGAVETLVLRLAQGSASRGPAPTSARMEGG